MFIYAKKKKKEANILGPNTLREKIGSNDNAMSTAQPLILIFKRESYEFWSFRMKTLLKFQDLWKEQGYVDPDDEGKLREKMKKDSKVLVIIQQAIHDIVFL